jgi:hypothetical protein
MVQFQMEMFHSVSIQLILFLDMETIKKSCNKMMLKKLALFPQQLSFKSKQSRVSLLAEHIIECPTGQDTLMMMTGGGNIMMTEELGGVVIHPQPGRRSTKECTKAEIVTEKMTV